MISIEVMSFKTKHWEYESEYRIIQEEDYYHIKGNIQSIYLGKRISKFHSDLLRKTIPEQIPIYTTEINPNTIKVKKKNKL